MFTNVRSRPALYFAVSVLEINRSLGSVQFHSCAMSMSLAQCKHWALQPLYCTFPHEWHFIPGPIWSLLLHAQKPGHIVLPQVVNLKFGRSRKWRQFLHWNLGCSPGACVQGNGNHGTDIDLPQWTSVKLSICQSTWYCLEEIYPLGNHPVLYACMKKS
jgi:hypothetical protein